jgi:methylmalonyl-CoA mutase
MMESMTNDMADQAWALIEEIDSHGGMVEYISSGRAKRSIEESAVARQSRIDSAVDTIVGVNKYKRERAEDGMTLLEVDNHVVQKTQWSRLARLKKRRDGEAVSRSLAALTECARTGSGNLLELAVAAMRVRATVGEVSFALEKEWGRYTIPKTTIAGVYAAQYSKDEDWARAIDEMRRFEAEMKRKPRLLLSKTGQDGHDRGINAVASAFLDIGFEVEIHPFFPLADEIAEYCVGKSFDVIGISSMTAGHKSFIPALIRELGKRRVGGLVVVGGTVPDKDAESLKRAGVACTFGPGTKLTAAAFEILAALLPRREVTEREGTRRKPISRTS